MAIAFDNASTGKTTTSATLTFSHTVGSGSNRLLVVQAVCDQNHDPTGITFNGVAMTFVASQQRATKKVSVWYLLAPASGAHDVVITYATSKDDIGGIASSYTGAKQSGQPDANGTGSGYGSSGSVNITTVADNSLIIGAIFNTVAGTDIVPDGTQTERAEDFTTGLDDLRFELSDKIQATAGATTMSVTSMGNASWAYVAVSFSPHIALEANPIASSYNIELRDKDGNLRQYLTPFVTSCKWAWNRIGGCGRCRIKLKKSYRDIEFSARDDIQIRLTSGATTKLVYRGWVAGTIPSLKIGQDITLDVRGYFDLLDMIVVQNSGDSKSYSNTVISDIVDDIVDTFITPNSSITKGTIDASFFTADSLSFKTTVAEALRTCAELLGDVEYGVDEDLAFYWRTESETLNHKFFVGNNVQMLERRQDVSKLVNKIYFEGGDVSGSPYLKTAQATDSQTIYGLAEDIVANSAITTPSVADQYLSAILKKRARPTIIIRAKIPNTDIRIEDNIPLGKVAVYDADYDDSTNIWGKTASGGSNLIWGRTASGGSNKIWGGVFKDQVNRVSYSLSDTSERVNMEILMGDTILETSAKINRIELLLSNLRQR